MSEEVAYLTWFHVEPYHNDSFVVVNNHGSICGYYDTYDQALEAIEELYQL